MNLDRSAIAGIDPTLTLPQLMKLNSGLENGLRRMAESAIAAVGAADAVVVLSDALGFCTVVSGPINPRVGTELRSLVEVHQKLPARNALDKVEHDSLALASGLTLPLLRLPVYNEGGAVAAQIWIVAKEESGFDRGAINTLRAIASNGQSMCEMQLLHLADVQRLAATWVATPALMFMLDGCGAMVAVSDLWLSHFAYRRDQVLGHDVSQFMGSEARQIFEDIRNRVWRDGGVRDHPLQFKCSDGNSVDVLMSASIEFDQAGVPISIKCALTDVTQALRVRRIVEQDHDLPGTLARGEFLARLELSLACQMGTHSTFCLLIIDTDQYGVPANSTGRSAGADVQRALALEINRFLPSACAMGRLGAGEFAVMMPDTSVSQATEVAQRVEQQVHLLNDKIDSEYAHIGLCQGIAEADAEITAAQLLAKTDAALFWARRQGRIGISVLDAKSPSQDRSSDDLVAADPQVEATP